MSNGELIISEGLSGAGFSPGFNPEQKRESLGNVIDKYARKDGPLPEGSVLIGMCEDGLPFQLDWNNPRSGSVLIKGYGGSSYGVKEDFLRAALASANQIHKPSEVQFYILDFLSSPEYSINESNPFVGAAAVADADRAAEIIGQVEKLLGRDNGRAVLLAIAEIGTLKSNINDNAWDNLMRVIAEGPDSRIWTFATFTHGRDELPGNIIEPVPSDDIFGTRMVQLKSESGHPLSKFRTTILHQHDKAIDVTPFLV